ncbi:MAG: BtrH N-terminal domain-containing protein [Candidatus Hodarchaeales archaeon]|jgi:hypothetical protein
MSEIQEIDKFDGVIEGFKHEPGVHCTSSAVRDVFEFHGWKMSEALIFGLGSGMTLAYLKIPKMIPFFGGRNKDFVTDLCSSLSVSLNEFKSRNETEGWRRLKRHLDERTPSVIDIDMGYLNYQKSSLPSDDFHFGGHTIAICGFNSKQNTVFVADTNFPQLLEVTYDELIKGRNSTIDRFMAPNNLIYEFDFPVKLPELSTIIKDVLHRTGKYLTSKGGRMLRIMGIHSGTTAIDVLIKDLDRWLKQSDEKLQFVCMQQAGFIGTKEHNYGTGGGLFRYLFAEFLEEISIKLNNEFLHQLASFYEKLGRKWEICAESFTHIGEGLEKDETKRTLKDIKIDLSEIRKLEEEGANKLLNFVI